MLSNNMSNLAIVKLANIERGVTTTIDARVLPLAQAIGITFGPTNNVTANTTENRIGSLELQVTDLTNRIGTLEAQIATLIGHTHSYIDDTITDTTTGTGTITSTTKTTSTEQ